MAKGVFLDYHECISLGASDHVVKLVLADCIPQIRLVAG